MSPREDRRLRDIATAVLVEIATSEHSEPADRIAACRALLEETT